MGKQNSGPFANWSGKVGGLVGRVKGGLTVVSIYQPKVFNPKTTGQLTQRAKLKLISTFAQKNGKAIDYGFAQFKTNLKSARSLFMSYNIKNAVTGTYPNFEVNYGEVQFSQGTLENVDLPTCVDTGSGHIVVNWNDNSGIGEALATDKVCIVFFNKDKQIGGGSMMNVARSAATFSFTNPTTWSGDTIKVYVFAKRPDGIYGSRTIYVGSVIAS